MVNVNKKFLKIKEKNNIYFLHISKGKNINN